MNAAKLGITHTRALAACCTVFSCVLLVEATINWAEFGKTVEAADETPIKTAATHESSPHADIDMEKYQVIVERPLFTTTRRLPDGETPVALSSEPTLVREAPSGAVNLLGIVIVADTRRALLRFGPDDTRLVSIGESVEGWELRNIEQGAVRLVRSGHEQRIELLRKAGPQREKQPNRQAQLAADK